MQLIVQKDKDSSLRTIQITTPFIAAVVGVFMLSAALLGAAGVFAMQQWGGLIIDPQGTSAWQQRLQETRLQFKEAREHSDQQLSALTMRVADLQSQLIRINALGERLVTVAGIDPEEFDFTATVAIGGAASLEDELSLSVDAATLKLELNELEGLLARREQQLSLLERLLDGNDFAERTLVAGHPVVKGYLSSHFGQRRDPFTGRIRYHRGVDFAAPTGTSVMATGGGIVTFAGVKNGYGVTVDVKHGNGMTTRYAHLRSIKTKKGEAVAAGEVIGTVGSTGRSTGPHVHYEVLKNGQQVNPATYLAKKRA
ncbi:MAG TPA: M23 family metallopeptidase [Alcanivoracaceae bacterium]|nr:M23 family metallopeptidase [Alcanivoracaceae bacterium]